jgi:hypothetical protein
MYNAAILSSLFCLFCQITSAQLKDIIANPYGIKLAKAAESLTEDVVDYDPTYYVIKYPGGDVPAGKGVCTDVVIRAYRKLGIDLQKNVHEDMKARFSEYPSRWGLKKPDSNIDHRRVPNLMEYFRVHGKTLDKTKNAEHYLPGDIVCWDLGGGVTHIGIVSSQKAGLSDRYLVVHNIGAGQVLEDCLFNFTIIGHYRFPRI